MRYKAVVFASLLAIGAEAQEVIVHKAGPSDGKIFTMEEVVTHNRGVYPSYPSVEEYAALDSFGFTYAGAGTMRAWSDNGTLKLKKKDGTEIVIAPKEDPDITYGTIVSRNEFGIDEGIFWSPDSTKIAFYRNDESRVTDFPLLDITTRTGSLRSIKYPMAGMDSERLNLLIYDIASGRITWTDVDDFGVDRYLTNISWGPDSRRIFIQVLDRTQKHCRLNMYDAGNGRFLRTVLTEDDEKYVEPLDKITFIGNNWHFIYRTNNRDGYRNLYLCDTLGTVRRITQVDADVELSAVSGKSIFYTSAEVSPVENHLFRIDYKEAKGRRGKEVANTSFSKPVRLTPAEGWHSVRFNNDKTCFLDAFSSYNVPDVYEVRSSEGKLLKEIHRSEDPVKDYATGEVRFGTVKSADGLYDNYYKMYLPKDFDPSKKYPVIVYVYGGPHLQLVRNSWLGGVDMWHMLMAQKGYIVYTQDNRGTPNRGKTFEQVIHRQCGQAEMEDQMEGVKMLQSLPFVESSRIGVHGWSYGGFLTMSLITNYPEVFKVAVAGGPVIDWKWYEVMYGERYMETPEMNPEGYERTSLIGKAKDLKGKLLICQGALDNTVLWEHSLSFVRECIKNNVQVDYSPYPCAEHNVTGRDRIHLMDKVTMYFDYFL